MPRVPEGTPVRSTVTIIVPEAVGVRSTVPAIQSGPVTCAVIAAV